MESDTPVELLVAIFKYLPLKDVVTCSVVCNQWRLAANEQMIWRDLTMDHWKFGLPAELHSPNWREYYVSRHNQDLQVSGLLSVLFSGKQTENRSNKRQAKNTLLRLGVSILDRLNYLSSPSSSNLSIAYYATQITDEINHNICLSWWEDLLSNTSAPLEEGAIIIAKWEYPQLDASQVRVSLDEIANKVKSKFQEFGVSVTKNLSREVFEEALVTEQEDIKVLKAIHHVMFEDLKFHGNTEDYYNPKNSFINDVISNAQGIPISLSVLFAAVARRLGVCLDPIGFPSHFLLGYKPLTNKPIYIDAFRGSFLTHNDCVELLNYNLPSVNFTDEFLAPIRNENVWYRMLTNLLHIYKSECDFGKMGGVADQLLQMRMGSVGELYLKLQIMLIQEKYEEVEEYMPQLSKMSQAHYLELQRKLSPHLSEKLKVKSRETEEYSVIKYKIGQVVKHVATGAVGVIVGYDSKCKTNEELETNVMQPFYTVWGSEQRRLYLAEKSIVLCSERVESLHFGRFFTHFDSSKEMFVPNLDTLSEYPDL